MERIHWLLISTVFLMSPSFSTAQTRAVDSVEVYKVQPLLSIGLSLTGAWLTTYGRERNLEKSMLSVEELTGLREEDVNAFDRVALRQDLSKSEQVATRSDALLLAGAALPVFLFLDRDIRRDWIDISSLYLESQVATSLLHTWGPLGPTFFNRTRPAAYYEGLELENRMGGNQRNSFYSGHVASVATATFFMAKVLDDYHPEWRGKQWLFYGLAAVPPAVMGVMRVQAVRHFPSDAVVGGVLGALTGILIPELHRIKSGQAKLSLQYGAAMKGMAFSLTF